MINLDEFTQLKFIENKVTGRIGYRMFFMGHNVVSGSLCKLNLIKNL